LKRRMICLLILEGSMAKTLKQLSEDALVLKAACKEAGVSSLIVLIDDNQHHSTSRSIFTQHRVAMVGEVEKQFAHRGNDKGESDG